MTVKIGLSSAGVYECYLPNGFFLVRGTEGADYRAAKRLAERLIDWIAGGYALVYHPTGDVGVWVESAVSPLF